MQERDQAVQKRAYKLLATVCEQRPVYLRSHVQVRAHSQTRILHDVRRCALFLYMHLGSAVFA